MTTKFEFFEGTATVHSTTPRVTVRKSGQLVLTEAAVALLGEGVEAVQIGFYVFGAVKFLSVWPWASSWRLPFSCARSSLVLPSIRAGPPRRTPHA